ncbi:hypothetical protein Bcell_0928 [Evansella cellulosilytica DSM 2522]|uniref:Uncharacterized protein n=1 Tax=Evansella cellulosilytica (strain ATCC 21833 / DSM 2522 / FERM P-1141 / JCM 9156 / N-4) TaxID=649639 RepID=E6U1F7_EVAC2|nr:hypothetical protein Bcell_0928 [Evansella cellulosilytica DSM 2522]
MNKNLFLLPILVGVIFFVLAVILFTFIESPFPYFAGLFVAFIVFEITFFYRFTKNKNETRSKL